MITKRLLRTMGITEAPEVKTTTVRETCVVEINSQIEGCIKNAIVEGCCNTLDNNNIILGAGEQTDSGTVLRMRMHGESWLDGYELVRIMKELGCTCYGGEYDDDHFIISPYLGECDITSPYHLRTRSRIYHFYAKTLVTNDLGESERAPGIDFKHNKSLSISIPLACGSIGTQELSGKSYYTQLWGLHAKPVQDNFDLIIPYDSVTMVEGSYSSVIPYDGYTICFPLNRPLYKMNNESACDSLDVLSGIVTREVGIFEFDEDTVINAGEYEGYACYYVTLPERASGGSRIHSNFFLSNTTIEENKAMVISADGCKAFFNIQDADSVESAGTMLAEKKYNFLYELATSYTEATGVKLKNTERTGLHYLEACTSGTPYILVEYVC